MTSSLQTRKAADKHHGIICTFVNEVNTLCENQRIFFSRKMFLYLNFVSGYVVVEEGIDILDTIATPKQREAYDSYDAYQGDQNLCPGKTSCTTLTDCRLLLDLMERSCLLPNK